MGVILSLILLPDAILSDALPDAVLVVGKFSNTPEGVAVPVGWEPLTFKKIPRHTRYTLVMESGRVVVKATSESSSSGLIRKIRIDPKEFSLIEWRWKILNIYQKGDVTTKEGDDYPARLYITFESDPADMGLFEKIKYETARLFYGEYPPSSAITYIWESKTPKGSVVSNPYTDRVRMIVVESGDSLLNQWLLEERNVYEDYKSAFGREPPMISGVAIMTDSDNTGESTTAFYGDIIFKKSVK